MPNQMKRNREHEVETGIVRGATGVILLGHPKHYGSHHNKDKQRGNTILTTYQLDFGEYRL